MAEKKINELPVANTVSLNDRLLFVVSPLSNTEVKIANVSVLNSLLIGMASNSVPANSTSNGVAGTIAYSNAHLFICYETNKWGRISFTTTW